MSPANAGQRSKDPDVNVPREHDERKTDHGFRFYPVVTLGNVLSVVGFLIPILIWGARLESRVDHQEDLRVRLEKTVEQTQAEGRRQNDRIEVLMSKVAEDLTQLKVAVSSIRQASLPAAPTDRKIP